MFMIVVLVMSVMMVMIVMTVTYLLEAQRDARAAVTTRAKREIMFYKKNVKGIVKKLELSLTTIKGHVIKPDDEESPAEGGIVPSTRQFTPGISPT